MSGSSESGYQRGKTIQQVADEWVQFLKDDIDTLSSDSPYGIETVTVVRMTLAGGGPGAQIDFEFSESTDPLYLMDEEPDGATLHYYEPGGTASAVLGWQEAADLWRALNRSPDDLPAEDEDDDEDEGE